MFIIKKIINRINTGNARSIEAKKNIIGSLFLKAISILISLQVVPLTIGYINSTRYGLWLTLSSIIAWLSYFDLGFTHGFRNKFAEATANNDILLAKKYVSTTYAILLLVFSCICAFTLSISNYIDWASILNIDVEYNDELTKVFQVLVCIFCVNLVASVFSTMLTAYQKPVYTSVIKTGGQVVAFIAIFLLTKTTEGNLTYLALAFSGIPCLLLVIVSIIVFQTKTFSKFKPSFSCIQMDLSRKILSLGGQFFVIMISILVIFQFINIIISRVLGPEAVTEYNIAYKLFNVLNMACMIILTPFWSACTDAYTKKDFAWMRNICKKLEMVWALCIPIALILVLLSPYIFNWWIGPAVSVSMNLSASMALYVLSQIIGNIYMYQINGTGKIRLQLIVYVIFCIVAIPLLHFSCRQWGLEGMLFVVSIVFLIQAIVGKIQLSKILSNNATGIWNK